MKPEGWLGLAMIAGTAYFVYLLRFYKRVNTVPLSEKKTVVAGVRG